MFRCFGRKAKKTKPKVVDIVPTAAARPPRESLSDVNYRMRAEVDRDRRHQEMQILKNKSNEIYGNIRQKDIEHNRRNSAEIDRRRLQKTPVDMLSPKDRIRKIMCQCIAFIGKPDWQELMTYKNRPDITKQYDLNRVNDILSLIGDYCGSHEGPCDRLRYAHAYMLLKIHEDNPVTKYDIAQCAEEPECYWNSTRHINKMLPVDQRGVCIPINPPETNAVLGPTTADEILTMWQPTPSKS
jgi:hypothetical protein